MLLLIMKIYDVINQKCYKEIKEKRHKEKCYKEIILSHYKKYIKYKLQKIYISDIKI